MSDFILIPLLIFGGTITYVILGMFAYYLMVEKAGFRDTEGCAILASLWPVTFLFWLLIGWPLLLTGWSYKMVTKPRRRPSRIKPQEVK